MPSLERHLGNLRAYYALSYTKTRDGFLGRHPSIPTPRPRSTVSPKLVQVVHSDAVTCKHMIRSVNGRISR
jgi:hypothetical protein